MDPSLGPEQRAAVQAVLDRYVAAHGIRWHALRTRSSPARNFLSVHILVPGAWSVKQGHDLVDALEDELVAAVPNLHVSTHLEPLEDETAYADRAM